MDAKITESILTKLNHRFVYEKCSISLFMDNAGCHPEDLKSKFSNINIGFLPPNTTSKLQPLDLGIIKVHYRKLFFQHVLARIDERDIATEVANSVNILVAIRWVAKAWLAVKETTICKCFQKAVILDSTLNVVSCDLTADESMALQGLIDEAMTCCDHCPLEEYVNGEDNVPVCVDACSDTWEEEFFDNLGQEDQGEEDQDEENSDNEQPSPEFEPLQ